MVSIDPKNLTVQKLHQYLLGAIGPRPIAFASTVDAEGKPNLAPFSFFNVFSANPPILIFRLLDLEGQILQKILIIM